VPSAQFAYWLTVCPTQDHERADKSSDFPVYIARPLPDLCQRLRLFGWRFTWPLGSPSSPITNRQFKNPNLSISHKRRLDNFANEQGFGKFKNEVVSPVLGHVLPS
jgi:hypothetical protein